MLRLNQTHKSRVSNRLAIVAAFLLMTSIVAGLDRSMLASGESNSLAVETGARSAETVNAPANRTSRAKQKKSFKVSLFLLR